MITFQSNTPATPVFGQRTRELAGKPWSADERAKKLFSLQRLRIPGIFSYDASYTQIDKEAALALIEKANDPKLLLDIMGLTVQAFRGEKTPFAGLIGDVKRLEPGGYDPHTGPSLLESEEGTQIFGQTLRDYRQVFQAAGNRVYEITRNDPAKKTRVKAVLAQAGMPLNESSLSNEISVRFPSYGDRLSR